jgi:autotransporter-associated beta strand protein
LGALPAARAASDTWTGAGDALWSNTGNWLGGTIPGAGNTATFNAASGNTTVDLGAGVTLGTLLFDTANASAYTIGSGGAGNQTLTLDTLAGGIQMNSTVAANQLINANLALSTTGTYAVGLTNDSTTNTLTVAGGISASTAGTKTLTVTGAGNTTISGDIASGSGAVALTKSGTGALTLSGTNTLGGNLVVNTGRVNVTSGTTTSSNNASGNIQLGAASDTGRLNISSGATVTATSGGQFFRIGANASSVGILNNAGTFTATGSLGGNLGNAANASGAIYNSGTFNGPTVVGGVGFYLGNNGTNSYGYISNSGTFAADATGTRIWVGAAANATGVIDLTGGTLNTSAVNFYVGGGSGGSGGLNANNTNTQINVTGGTMTLSGTGTWNIIGGTSTGSYSNINITGSGKISNGGTTAGISLGANSNATNTANLTLATGGTLETAFINKGALSTGVLSFNNGTLKATAADATGLIRSGVSTFVQSGGGTIDNGGFNTTVASALQAPTGSGVTNITLGGTLTGYVGAPVVKITGGGGTGATAIANFDPTTGTITGITITSAGSGYTSDPTITLLGGGGTIGAGAGASTATATATIGSVSSGGMTFTGSGTTTLTGANTYTGATNVNAGTLVYSGATSTVGSIAVADGANLQVKSFSPSSNVLSATSLTLGSTSGSTLTADFNNLANPSAAPITLSGGLTIHGATLAGLNSAGLTNTNGSPFTLISATGGITGTFANSSVTLGARSTGAIGYTSNSVTLDITTDSITWSGASNSTWTTGTNGSVGPNPNWATTTGHTATDFWAGDVVKFGDTYNIGSGNTPVTNSAVSISGGNVSPASVTFNNSTVNYTISSGDGSGIAGSGALIKNGTGTVTISSSNSYSGGTTINAGTLVLSGAGTLGSTSGALAMGGGALDLGTTIQTVGATTITAAAASGNTIHNGTLTPTSLTASNSTGNAIVAADIAGSGGVTVNGAGRLTLSGNNTYTGATTVNAGTLALSGVYSGGGALTVNAGATLTGTSSGSNTIGNFLVTGAASSATLTSGTYNVTSTSSGGSANTRIDNGGSLTVDGATLNISGTWFPIGDTAATTSTVTLNSGAINVTNNFGVEVGRVGNGVLNINGGTFTVDDANSVGFIIGDQVTAESGTVNLNGGVLAVRLLKSNNGTNALNFNGGTLQATSTNSGGTFWNSSSKLTANVRNNGGTIDNNGTSVTIGQALVHSTIGGDNEIDGGMTFKGAGTTTLAGFSTYTGATHVNGGTLQLASTGSLSGSISLGVASGATLVLDNSISLNDAIVLSLVDGATLNLNFADVETVGALSLNGIFAPAGTYTVAQLGALAGAGTISFTGTGSLTIAPVPEPGVFGLLGLGLAGVLFLRRRR